MLLKVDMYEVISTTFLTQSCIEVSGVCLERLNAVGSLMIGICAIWIKRRSAGIAPPIVHMFLKINCEF